MRLTDCLIYQQPSKFIINCRPLFCVHCCESVGLHFFACVCMQENWCVSAYTDMSEGAHTCTVWTTACVSVWKDSMIDSAEAEGCEAVGFS